MLSVHVSDRVPQRRCCCERRRQSWRQCVSAMLTLLVASSIGCGGSPEVTSEAGLKSLDVLYTAVTSRKPELLDQCAIQVNHLETSGDLSGSAADSMEGVIQLAEAGDWQQAAERLDKYIRLQTRR